MDGDDVENITWHTPNVEPLTKEEVEAEMQRLEEEAVAAEQAKIASKESAIAKLASLGLTEDEVLALLGNAGV
jgi:2-hydroxychromene-2-carboxylate isomerase